MDRSLQSSSHSVFQSQLLFVVSAFLKSFWGTTNIGAFHWLIFGRMIPSSNIFSISTYFFCVSQVDDTGGHSPRAISTHINFMSYKLTRHIPDRMYRRILHRFVLRLFFLLHLIKCCVHSDISKFFTRLQRFFNFALRYLHQMFFRGI